MVGPLQRRVAPQTIDNGRALRVNDPLYLDFNATTPLLPEVVDAMLPYLREHFGNPSSSHVYGRRAKAAVEQARAEVAGLLSCSSDEVLFTSGGTESNNLALAGLAGDERRAFVTSVIEHPATLAPLKDLERTGSTVQWLGVSPTGEVEVPAELAPRAFVSIMHSNNETGVLQPIARLAERARAANGVMHTDASQSVGKVKVDVRALGVDALTVCGHKLYAPKGVGALFVRAGLGVRPFMRGAGHERGLRPGTENVASIVGLGRAAAIATETLGAEQQRVSGLRDELLALLRAGIPGVVVNGEGAPRLPNTLSIRFPHVTGAALLEATPSIAASTGSACHDGHETASAVVLAMGVPPAEAVGTVRLSLGRSTSARDVELAAAALTAGWRALTAR